MSEQVQHDLAEETIRLRDIAYIGWAAAESESGQALGKWYRATPSRRVAAYVGYCAALEREEAAARDLERLSALAGPARAALETPVGEAR